jgi:hypothetical protein
MNNAELTWVLLAVALVQTLVARLLWRRMRLLLRPIDAYRVLPEQAADAVESSNRIHFSLGSGALGESSSVSALAAVEVIYRLSERLAVSRQTPLITLSQPLTLPLAQDTLRRAYEFRRNMGHYRSSAAAWYPQGARSLSFAAGAASLAADTDAHSSVLMGRFGVEMALLGESALRHDQGLIAHSDLPEGQAVAFAQADEVLLGEELYVAAAYLNGSPLERGGVVTLDVLRWLVIVGIIVAAVQAAV